MAKRISYPKMPTANRECELRSAPTRAGVRVQSLQGQVVRPERHPVLSIVVRALNESENLLVLHQHLIQVLEHLGESYEIILVDDGSTDSTWECVESLAHNDEAVRGIRFSRNFGRQAALMAGLQFSTGDAVITMDADLQHPPQLIPKLVREWRDGTTIVNTVRIYPEGTGFFKKFTSGMFYRIINRLSNTKIITNAADFRLMDRKAVDVLCGLGERRLFLRGLSQWIGFSQSSVSFEASERCAGDTKYSPGKLIQLALSGLTSFSDVPLRVATWLGLGFVLLSGLCVVYLLLPGLFGGSAVGGWQWVLSAVLFAAGVQFIVLGVIGEYIARIHEEVKGRPLYVINEVCDPGERIDIEGKD